jgi:hypothetical protein
MLLVHHTSKISSHCLTGCQADKEKTGASQWCAICGDMGSAEAMVSTTKHFFPTTALDVSYEVW